MKPQKYLLALLLASVPGLFAAAPAQAALPRYSVTRLPAGLGPFDINNSGAMLGQFSTNFGEHCYIMEHGVVTDLGTLTGPTGQFCGPARINASAVATGWSVNANGDQRAFLYEQGIMHDLGTLGGRHSTGHAINDGGMVVGYAEFDSSDNRHAFAYLHGAMTDLGTLGGNFSSANAVNNQGVIVGESTVSTDPLSDSHAFLFKNGVMSDLGSLGGTLASALLINEAGLVAGHATLADGSYHLFVYENSTLTDIGSLGGNFATVYGINNQGTIVGIAEPVGSSMVAVLYAEGQLVTVDSLIDPALGWQITFARSINDRGQIIGIGCREQECSSVLLDPVP
jgi:probable HAF family extracellular repeat protein